MERLAAGQDTVERAAAPHRTAGHAAFHGAVPNRCAGLPRGGTADTVCGGRLVSAGEPALCCIKIIK